jgi:hypothetical protein
MSDGSSLLWRQCRNHVRATCPHSSNGSLMSDDPSLLWGPVATMCMPHAPVVVTSKECPLLLGQNIKDGTVVVGHLPVATEGYEL